MSNKLQETIIRNLLADEKYCRQVLPFIKPTYFNNEYRSLYEIYLNYVEKYNKIPSITSLKIDAENTPEDFFDSTLRLISNIESTKTEPVDEEWLLNTTEKWCKDRAVYLAIMESISIIEGKHQKYTPDALPDILQKALSVSFDKTVGHDYIEDAKKRWDLFHEPQDKLEFHLSMLNKITRDGVTRKSLTCILSGTGVGKSLFMCDYSAYLLSTGKNVLYITLEMAEEKIAERIDANLLNISMDQIQDVPRDLFASKIQKIHTKSNGRLIIKEFPTASAHTGHFRALLNELELKKNFKADCIFVDYLNICASSRVKNAAANSYTIAKSIAEELRGLSMEFNVPVVTATQSVRSAAEDSDFGITAVSESWGVPQTCDLFLAMISTEELGQIMFKQLKNRYNDVSTNRRFLVGIDRSKMKLFDLEDSAQKLIETEPKQKTQNYSGFKV